MSTYTSTILITGGTQGLGYHCTFSLARQCPQSLIIIASRRDADNAATTINKQLKQSNVKFMPLDLGSFANVRIFVEKYKATPNLPPISALVLNAGIQLPTSIEYTDDGIEKHFAVNHVGHALLFHLLTPTLTPDARVVVVASGVHDPAQGWGLKPAYTTAEKVARPDEAAVNKSNGRDRYATSKVANVLWAAALGRHMSTLPAHNAKTVVSFDPGLMFATQFTREAAWPIRFMSRYVAPMLIPVLRLWKANINMPQESGDNLAWYVVSGEVRGKKGEFFEKRVQRETSVQAKGVKLQEELWTWTVDKITEGKEEREKFERIE